MTTESVPFRRPCQQRSLGEAFPRIGFQDRHTIIPAIEISARDKTYVLHLPPVSVCDDPRPFGTSISVGQ